MTDRRSTGEAVRRAVLGDAHVDRSTEDGDGFDAPFRELITEAAWGNVWASDRLTRRERSMLTLALLAGLGNIEEFTMHAEATKRTGASREDIAEVLQHVAIYAGVPRANAALKAARKVFAREDAACAR